jgi:hypothetical protein
LGYPVLKGSWEEKEEEETEKKQPENANQVTRVL